MSRNEYERLGRHVKLLRSMLAEHDKTQVLQQEQRSEIELMREQMREVNRHAAERAAKEQAADIAIIKMLQTKLETLEHVQCFPCYLVALPLSLPALPCCLVALPLSLPAVPCCLVALPLSLHASFFVCVSLRELVVCADCVRACGCCFSPPVPLFCVLGWRVQEKLKDGGLISELEQQSRMLAQALVQKEDDLVRALCPLCVCQGAAVRLCSAGGGGGVAMLVLASHRHTNPAAYAHAGMECDVIQSIIHI